jgi:hypothetical protein
MQLVSWFEEKERKIFFNFSMVVELSENGLLYNKIKLYIWYMGDNDIERVIIIAITKWPKIMYYYNT